MLYYWRETVFYEPFKNMKNIAAEDADALQVFWLYKRFKRRVWLRSVHRNYNGMLNFRRYKNIPNFNLRGAYYYWLYRIPLLKPLKVMCSLASRRYPPFWRLSTFQLPVQRLPHLLCQVKLLYFLQSGFMRHL